MLSAGIVATVALAPLRALADFRNPDRSTTQIVAQPAPDRRGPIFKLCPVDAPRHYIDDFGAPRWVGGFHRHQGIDIMAPRGTPIRAPFDGTATSSSSWAGGLQVRVEGRRGLVFNAHLSKIGKMGKVRAGTIVGYVGNSGDAAGGPTHDHFEWHPGTPPTNPWVSPMGVSGVGSAVDPYPYLRAVC